MLIIYKHIIGKIIKAGVLLSLISHVGMLLIYKLGFPLLFAVAVAPLPLACVLLGPVFVSQLMNLFLAFPYRRWKLALLVSAINLSGAAVGLGLFAAFITLFGVIVGKPIDLRDALQFPFYLARWPGNLRDPIELVILFYEINGGILFLSFAVRVSPGQARSLAASQASGTDQKIRDFAFYGTGIIVGLLLLTIGPFFPMASGLILLLMLVGAIVPHAWVLPADRQRKFRRALVSLMVIQTVAIYAVAYSAALSSEQELRLRGLNLLGRIGPGLERSAFPSLVSAPLDADSVDNLIDIISPIEFFRDRRPWKMGEAPISYRELIAHQRNLKVLNSLTWLYRPEALNEEDFRALLNGPNREIDRWAYLPGEFVWLRVPMSDEFISLLMASTTPAISRFAYRYAEFHPSQDLFPSAVSNFLKSAPLEGAEQALRTISVMAGSRLRAGDLTKNEFNYRMKVFDCDSLTLDDLFAMKERSDEPRFNQCLRKKYVALKPDHDSFGLLSRWITLPAKGLKKELELR